MNLKDAPPVLGLPSHMYAREFADDGKFIASARDGEEGALRCPCGNRRIGHEPRNRETFWQQSEFEVAGGDGHCELEETPDKAAIHRDGSAVDVAGALGGEERDHCGEFFRSAHAACRNFALPAGENFLRLRAGTLGDGGSEIVEARSTSEAGANVIYGDAVGAVFIGKGACQAGDGGANRIRKQKPLNRLFDRRRGNCNQTSPLILLHARQNFPGKVHRAHQKLVNGSAPVFRLGVPKQVRRRTAGIGNADVDAAEASLHSGNKGGNCWEISDIEGLVEDIPARGFVNVRGGIRQGSRGARANGDAGAFVGEFLRDGAAESLAGSRDDGDAACETQIQSCTPSKTLIVSRNVKCVNQCSHFVDHEITKGPESGNLPTISGDWICSHKRIVETRKNWLDAHPV